MGNIMTVVFFFPAKQMLLLHESSRLSEGLTRRPLIQLKLLWLQKQPIVHLQVKTRLELTSF